MIDMLLVIVGLVLLGLVLGSFVNALVWRFHEQDDVRDEIEEIEEARAGTKAISKQSAQRLEKLKERLATLSMSKGRSMCSLCSHPLAVRDLIPLGSWLWLKGRCRYCHKPISDTPWLEALLPAALVASYVFWPLPMEGYGILAFAFWVVFATGFAALLVYDLRWYLLPDRIVWPLAALAAVQVVLHSTLFGGGSQVIAEAAWGVAGASGVFLLLYIVSSGRWIGFGDVKLGIVLGLLVGGPLQGLLVIFLASVLGSLASVPMMVRGRLKGDSVIPFGPFLIIATTLLVLFGQPVTDALRAYLVL